MAFVRGLFPNGDPRNADGFYVNPDGSRVALRPEFAGALTALAGEYERTFWSRPYVNEGMRSRDTQRYYWDLYQRGVGNLAAYPGTSTHGLGLAVDLDYPLDRSSTVEHRWWQENAPRFGIYWQGLEEGWEQIEPWHWGFDGRNSTDEQIERYRQAGLTGHYEEDDLKTDERAWLQRLHDRIGSLDMMMLAVLGNEKQAGMHARFDAVDRRATAVQAASDQINWGVNDPQAGVRTMIAALARKQGVDVLTLGKQIADTIRPDVIAAVERAGAGASPEQIADELAKRLAA